MARVATFSFAFASFYYYGSWLGGRIDDAEPAQCSRRGDRLWLLGDVLLFLAPSMILLGQRLQIGVGCHERSSPRENQKNFSRLKRDLEFYRS